MLKTPDYQGIPVDSVSAAAVKSYLNSSEHVPKVQGMADERQREEFIETIRASV
jgi:hypothetical protein